MEIQFLLTVPFRFFSSAYHSTEVSIIFDLTINTASLSASTLVGCTIGYQHIDEK